MSALILRELTANDENEFLKAYKSWEDAKGFVFAAGYDPSMKFSDYLKQLSDLKNGINLPQGYVPGTSLFAFIDSEIVGRASIRHELNEFLIKVGGHVGYGVLPQHRRKGYAKAMLKGSLDFCVNNLGLKKVLVTCDDDNIGSIKTIESARGILENKIDGGAGKVLRRRYWINL